MSETSTLCDPWQEDYGTWRRLTTVSPGKSLTGVRAVSAFLTGSQTRWVVPRSSGTGSQGAARARMSSLGILELLLCSLQMLWFCWLHQTMISSMHGGGLQPGWQSAPPSLRPRCSAGRWWIAPCGLGVSCCPKWRSSSILVSCWPVRVKCVRSTGGLVRYQTTVVKRVLSLPAGLCSNPHLWSWALGSDRNNEIANTSGWNEFPPQGSVLEGELGVELLLLHVERSQLRWDGPLIRILLNAFLWRFSGHVQLEGVPGADQNTLERLYISSGSGTPQDPPGGAGKCCWGEGRLDYLAATMNHAPD